ncbi:MAG: hypothetical protein ACFFEV_10680, partial [Candidatus Thorarchaeota archaeon]
MGLIQKLTLTIFTRVGIGRVMKIKEKQLSLGEFPGMIGSTENSPTRFEIPQEMILLMKERADIKVHQKFPIRTLLSNMKNINLSVDSLAKNPKGPAMSATPVFLETLKEFIYATDVDILEFVKLPHDLIFQGAGIIYDNAIILAMEMSQEKIIKAPS